VSCARSQCGDSCDQQVRTDRALTISTQLSSQRWRGRRCSVGCISVSIPSACLKMAVAIKGSGLDIRKALSRKVVQLYRRMVSTLPPAAIVAMLYAFVERVDE